MKKEKTIAFSIVVLMVVLGVGINVLAQAPGHDSKTAPLVTNKTTALQVVSVNASGPATPAGQSIEVVMKNVSTKKIIGYSIGYSKGGTVTADMTSGAPPIAPGDQFKREVHQAADVVIRDVIFEDGSIDGDAAAAQEQLDRWAGMREQLERIYIFINAATPPADVEQLKAFLRGLPSEATADRSFHVTLGMRNIREEVLLEVLKFDRENFQSELAKLNERVMKRLQRLPGASP